MAQERTVRVMILNEIIYPDVEYLYTCYKSIGYNIEIIDNPRVIAVAFLKRIIPNLTKPAKFAFLKSNKFLENIVDSMFNMIRSIPNHETDSPHFLTWFCSDNFIENHVSHEEMKEIMEEREKIRHGLMPITTLSLQNQAFEIYLAGLNIEVNKNRR